MEPQTTTCRPCCSIAGLLGCCAILLAVLMPIAAVFGWFAFDRHGIVGFYATVVAALVCWLSASLALVAVFVGQRLQAGVQGILAGMLFRMGLPLAAGVALQQQGGPLATAGVFYLILGMYFFTLITETLLSLRFVAPPTIQPAKTA